MLAPQSPQHGKEKGNELGYVLAMLLRDMALHLLFEFNLRLYGGCAMNTKLLIDRELLERIIEEHAPGYHDCIDLLGYECEWCELRAALAKLGEKP